jgi:hypothetical protein
MSKHSPWPWIYLGRVKTGDDDTLEWPTVECASKRYIKPEGRTSDECEANARLIAAAPEMFELLYETRNHIDKSCRECESKAIVPEIDALLDKIEGGGK